MTKVAVVMGSETDIEFIKPCLKTLTDMGIDYQVFTLSAHRQPDKVRELGFNARDKGFEIVIAAAGGAAHLPGVLASQTTLPVIGVPLPTSEMKGVDSLYSIVQMPCGIPVATMAIGKSGSKNAAYLAAEILGLKYDNIRNNYQEYRRELQRKGND